MSNRQGYPVTSIYCKELRSVTESVTGAVILAKLEYWSKKYPDGFYKFWAPPKDPESNPMYKPGDSLTEELGMTLNELRGNTTKFVLKIDSSKWDVRNPDFQGYAYAAVYYRGRKVTYFFRNHEFLDRKIAEIGANPLQNFTGDSENPLQNFTDDSLQNFTDDSLQNFTDVLSTKSTKEYQIKKSVSKKQKKPIPENTEAEEKYRQILDQANLRMHDEPLIWTKALRQDLKELMQLLSLEEAQGRTEQLVQRVKSGYQKHDTYWMSKRATPRVVLTENLSKKFVAAIDKPRLDGQQGEPDEYDMTGYFN